MPIRPGSSNGEIDPICGDIVLLGVVKDGLEGGGDLLGSVRLGKLKGAPYNDAANVEDNGLGCLL